MKVETSSKKTVWKQNFMFLLQFPAELNNTISIMTSSHLSLYVTPWVDAISASSKQAHHAMHCQYTVSAT